ncbi:hypothetical protein ACWT_3948 [Actinoplanes sp. SE50]|uniref:PIN domain-containing protein n=1 Tax=unclassified Actinoplanes TaxID=2626549 RepID=UPI00023ED262|nr:MULTISPECIES: PIN domain-containing protein [unclassified Actinoplanes]AEV84972.1 hypothetical protein ACPL_4077 [Actinoplanes sp. SE50/110]ATO83363.1 hypothetical protein ACWT_3948 [Actinoplanes sp. SE50]SLM00770.1 hypothetical protein ACSP50_4003 [Actinoplanes sp. SE50/110]
MTGGRDAKLVLDTSAIAAWVRGSVAVGETLAEVNDEDGAVVIPLSCLVEAGYHTAVLGRERLELLLAHPATSLITDDAEDWDALVALRALTGRADCASAAMLALDLGVDVMTSDPSWYKGVADGRIVLHVED